MFQHSDQSGDAQADLPASGRFEDAITGLLVPDDLPPVEVTAESALALARSRARPEVARWLANQGNVPVVREPPAASPQPILGPLPPRLDDRETCVAEEQARAVRGAARQLEVVLAQQPWPGAEDRNPLSDFFGRGIPRVKLLTAILPRCEFQRARWVVLSQILYWLYRTSTKRCQVDGRETRYCSRSTAQLAEETGLSQRAVQVAMKALFADRTLVRCAVAGSYTLRHESRVPYLESPFAVVPAEWIKRLGVDQAVCLASVGSWFAARLYKKRKARIFRDGFLWIAKPYAELARETGLPEGGIRDTIDNLVDMRLLARECYKWKGRPTCHLRLDLHGTSAFFAAHNPAVQSAPSRTTTRNTRDSAPSRDHSAPSRVLERTIPRS